MFNLLKASANVLVQAAHEVAEEINQVANAPNPNFSSTRTTVGQGTAISGEGEAVCLGSDGRLVLCGFPDRNLADEVYREDRSLRPFTSPSKLKEFLTTRFPSSSSEFLVWNLSGKKYAYEELYGNIIEYDSHSRPILTFAALVEVATAIHMWLAQSPHNVAVVHDISGRRAAVVAACALELAEYHSRETSLRSIATEMGKAGNALVASQIRYFDYFCKSRKSDSLKYHVPERKLRLVRVIVNGVPDFSNDAKLAPSPELSSCVPFLRVFDMAGQELDCSLIPSKPVFGIDHSFSLTPTKKRLILQGDVMLRFFHRKLEDNNRDLAMFAVSFHVGFVTDVVLRFTLGEIDGTAKNVRFPKDMFIDIIFSDDAASTEEEKHLQEEDRMTTEKKAAEEEDFSKSALIRELEAIEDEDEDLVLASVPTSPANTVEETHAVQDVVVAAANSPKRPPERKTQEPKKVVELLASATKEFENPPAVSSPPQLASTVQRMESNDSISSELLKAVPPSPIQLDRGDSVLREIEAALEEDDFADEDFEISELMDDA